MRASQCNKKQCTYRCFRRLCALRWRRRARRSRRALQRGRRSERKTAWIRVLCYRVSSSTILAKCLPTRWRVGGEWVYTPFFHRTYSKTLFHPEDLSKLGHSKCIQITRMKSGEKSGPHPTHRPGRLFSSSEATLLHC